MGGALNPIASLKASNFGLDPMGAMIAASPQGVQNFVGKESRFDPLINSAVGKAITPENYALAQKYAQSVKYPNVSTTGPYAGQQQTLGLANQGYQPQGAVPAQPAGLGTAKPIATGAAVAAPMSTGITPQMRNAIWGQNQSQQQPGSGQALGSSWG